MLFSFGKVSKVKYLPTIIIFCDYFMRLSTEKRKMDIFSITEQLFRFKKMAHYNQTLS